MSVEFFFGTNEKLRRAERFIGELRESVSRFNENPGATVHKLAVEGPPQYRITYDNRVHHVGAIVGDAVHNMRASLDLLASEMARLNRRSDSSVYFPFARTAEDLPKMVKQKNFIFCGSAAVELISRIKPYPAGNKLLYSLHQLDLTDKHRIIIDTEKHSRYRISGCYDIERPDVHHESLAGISINHFFPVDSPLAGEPLIETLEAIRAEVGRIAGLFIALWP